MISVGLRDLNQHLSRFIKAVRAGEEILITDRGTPLATIVPFRPAEAEHARVRAAVAKGLLIEAESSDDPLLRAPVPLLGCPLAQTVSELRDEG